MVATPYVATVTTERAGPAIAPIGEQSPSLPTVYTSHWFSVTVLPTPVLRDARLGFDLPRGHVRVLSTRFGKLCLAHRDVASGRRTQLRLVRERPDTGTRLASEMAWLTHLAHAHALPVPRPLPWRDGGLVSPTLYATDGAPWRAVACSWVAGRHIGRGLTPSHLRRAGALVARLHGANGDIPDGITAARPTWWIPRLFELATSLRDVVEERGPLPPSVPPALAVALREATAALQGQHAALPDSPAHVGLIHTDAHWQNMRWTADRLGLVDFEDCATGRFMLDIACCHDRVRERHDSAALLDALLAGYDAVTPLPSGYADDLRVMRAFRRLDYAGWVLSWPRTDLRPWGPAFLAAAPGAILRLLER